MPTKTITITEDAYEILKAMKEPKESFSETIRRIGKRKPLSAFFGILSKEAGDKLEENVRKFRKEAEESYKKRIEKIRKAMED